MLSLRFLFEKKNNKQTNKTHTNTQKVLGMLVIFAIPCYIMLSKQTQWYWFDLEANNYIIGNLQHKSLKIIGKVKLSIFTKYFHGQDTLNLNEKCIFLSGEFFKFMLVYFYCLSFKL